MILLNAQNTRQFYPDYSKFDTSAVDVNLKQLLVPIGC